MDDLLAEFLAETREMLTAIGGELVAWEANPSDRERLDAVFRFVHTVKGNCGFFDFPQLEALSHAAEDALSEVRAGRRQVTPRLVTAVLAVIDRIGVMADAIESGEEVSPRDNDVLIAALGTDSEAELDGFGVPQSDSASVRVPSAVQRSIRLPVTLLDSVMSGVSDLVLARNDLARRLRESAADTGVDGTFDRLSSILGQVREAVTRMRMHRIENLYGALPRLVRDLSAELGKQVMLDLEGGDVELDREMIEMIRDPITHIIRNAIDHGIEPPSQRLAAGKREIGMLHISARQTGNRIVLALTDDGRGIDEHKLVERSIAAGTITRDQADAMTSEQRLALIFEPGLSTADEVTSVSGRGVGMDVVLSNIERIGGSIGVQSEVGEGTRIVLRLPLTLSIIPALTVESGGQLFAIPRSYIEEIVHSTSTHAEFARIGESLLVSVRGRRLPCLSLARVLGREEQLTPEQSSLVELRLAGGEVFILAADRIHKHEELVIKPLPPAIMGAGLYVGTTLLDDGTPVLMLDIGGIAIKAKLTEVNRRSMAVERTRNAAVEETTSLPVVVFCGLDGRKRAIRMSVVNRIDRVQSALIDLDGDTPQTVIGGAIFAVAGTEHGPLPPDETVLLRLIDGEAEIAYALQRIVDTAEIKGEIVPPKKPGPVEGTALIDGEPVDVVDAFWLFAAHRRPTKPAVAPVCALPEGDAWSRTFLQPLVESAGYRVVFGDESEPADVLITLGESEANIVTGAHVLTLHSDPESATSDGGIYRYDRAALTAALAAARARKAS